MPVLSIIYFAIAAIFIIIGILIFRGNTDLIHDYHQKTLRILTDTVKVWARELSV